MRKSAKFAVSIPWEEFKDLEAIRRKAGLSRSGFLLARSAPGRKRAKGTG